MSSEERPAGGGAAAPSADQAGGDGAPSQRKRARLEGDQPPLQDQEDGDDDDYEEYVPVKKRRELEEQRRLALLGRAPAPAAAAAAAAAAAPPGGGAAADAADAPAARRGTESLLVLKAKALAEAPPESAAERERREEEELMRQVAARKDLRTYKELAQGITYSRSVPTGWRPRLKYRRAPEAALQKVRDAFFIVAEGAHLPPPVPSFADMRLPPPILAHLEGKGIKKPTPIQMQGIPALLAGRDLIGVAFTGSGKTAAFSLPMVMAAAQAEARLPLAGGEGPVGLVLCPSRELARQTLEVVAGFAGALAAGPPPGPELRALVAIGGQDSKAFSDAVRERGVHMVVATPGRLKDLLARRRLTLDICRYLCLDEADRMVDLGFEDDIREILSFFRGQRQTAMFSATMPAKIKAFAESALVDPVEVNVGRSGAANLDIIQEVEYVKDEARLPFLLEVLQKTPPPVLVFAENKRDVDTIHEFLLVKGVEAVAVHGSKDQEEREWALDSFKAGKKDVLIATDVASKGLDFPMAIQHVVNYDMPSEIENYVHRIGRTGRRGRTGLATTFVSRSSPESALLDLKYLLREAKQRIPPVLLAVPDPMDALLAAEAADPAGAAGGCKYCGGLGHRVTDCPKLRADTREATKAKRDVFGSGGFGAEM